MQSYSKIAYGFSVSINATRKEFEKKRKPTFYRNNDSRASWLPLGTPYKFGSRFFKLPGCDGTKSVFHLQSQCFDFNYFFWDSGILAMAFLIRTKIPGTHKRAKVAG